MTNDYINNQIVKLIYNEVSVSEELALKLQISDDDMLMRSYTDMKRMKDKLDHSMSKPSHSSVQYILDYSRKQQRQASF